MSDYLVNLARRAAGAAPVARPRSEPGRGPIVGSRGAEQVAASRAPSRSGAVTGTDPFAASRTPRSIRADVVPDELERASGAPVLGPAVQADVGRSRRPDLTWPLEPRPSRAAERAAPAEGVADGARATASPGSPAPNTTGPLPPVRIPQAIAAPAPDSRRDPDPARYRSVVEPRRDAVVALPLPMASDRVRRPDAPRLALIEPAAVAGPPGGPRALIEGHRPGREVSVRIGTIEIHAESAGPGSTSLPAVAAPAPAAMPAGGFDDFVRLRTYAPWER